MRNELRAAGGIARLLRLTRECADPLVIERSLWTLNNMCSKNATNQTAVRALNHDPSASFPSMSSSPRTQYGVHTSCPSPT